MALITSIKSGNWSDPTIWDSGTVPTVGDDVVIDTGHIVTIDTNIGEIGSSVSGNVVDALTVQNGATLKWNGDVNCNLRLNGNWIIEDGAIIDFDGTSTPNYSLIIRYDINQYGNKIDTLGDTAVWKIQGYDRGVKWTVLTRLHTTAENQIEVKDVWNWKIGDTLDIIGYDKQSDLYTIVAIDYTNNIITLDRNLSSDKQKYSIVINQTSNIDIRTESPIASYQHYFKISNNRSNNILKNFTVFTNAHPSWTRMVNFAKNDLINTVILNTVTGIDGDYGGDLVATGCAIYCGLCNFAKLKNINNSAINSLSYRNKGMLIYNEKTINVYLGFRGGATSSLEYGFYFVDSYLVNLKGYYTSSSGILIAENTVIQNITDRIELRPSSKIIGGDIGTIAPINELRITDKYSEIKILDAYYDDTSINTLDIPDESILFISSKNNLHRTYTNLYKLYNQTAITYNGNESAEIQSLQAGTFELKSKILVDNNTSYKFDIYIMKDSLTTAPPKVQLWKGTTLLSEAQMPDTTNTWEKVSVSWFSDFEGFIEIRFVFTSDTGTEKFWLSDERNSFHYWSEGYIIPVYPKNEVTPDTVAKAVWEYSTRTITGSNKDAEIDAIKSQTDKLQFNTNNEVLSEATNMIPDKSAEIDTINNKINTNLDVPVSTRKSATQIDFTDSDRAHLRSLQNYDDTEVKNLLNLLLDIEQGNWEISNNQMIFYRRDGTELMRFNLLDKNNQPSETNVFKRVKV